MEQSYPYAPMNSFLNQVDQLTNFDFLAQFQEKYHAKQFKLTQISTANANSIYHEIYLKFTKNNNPNTQLHWGENELRLYMWMLACHLKLANIRIESLGERDWQHFCSILPNKQAILFEYQAISLYRQPVAAKKWSQQEDQIFQALVKKKDSKPKWSQLAKELYITSNRQYFRTPKQCRQRWLNHLDPNKCKDQWQLKQDYVLIRHVRQNGKKWAQISKRLNNRRNEHSIKNRFKSLITKQQKSHPQIKDENILIETIYKKYVNHFNKLQIMNAINKSNTFQQSKKMDSFHTHAETNKQINTNQIFQVYRAKDQCKVEASDQHSLISIQNHMPQVKSETFLDIFRKNREQEVRADTFLLDDPFQPLKRFFKSRDSFEYQD